MNRKRIINRVKILLIVYAVIGTVLYFVQDRLLLHPVAVHTDSSYSFRQPHRELFLPFDSSTRLHIVQFTVPDSLRKGVVLYFHGNKTNISRYVPYATAFTRNSYDVWMIDYPGFGKSTGIFSEEILYEAALQFYKLARASYPPQQIIIYGKSLGTGIAAQLAAIRDCRNLILETPYYGLSALIGSYLWMYPVNRMIHLKLPTYQYLPEITAPVTILHGTADEVIPYRNAAKLKALLKQQDRFLTIEGGKHNTLFNYPVVQQALDSLLK
ncbi:MAG: alpha/beta fold hydrolase [Sphingobacteriia bacterium]|nr:alpha/beta fold hydrolase [Sphingobacteriia bacterium]